MIIDLINNFELVGRAQMFRTYPHDFDLPLQQLLFDVLAATMLILSVETVSCRTSRTLSSFALMAYI